MTPNNELKLEFVAGYVESDTLTHISGMRA